MNEKDQRELLDLSPGTRRAANGVIMDFDDGSIFQTFNVYKEKELEGLTEDELFFVAFCSKKEILRLRELKNGHDFLLQIRAKAIVDSPRIVRVLNERRKLYEHEKRPWSLSHYYHSKDHFHKKYISYLTRSDFKKVASIPAGLAFIAEANAVCIRGLAGNVVLVSETLEKFYYFMSIAFFGRRIGIDEHDILSSLVIATRIMHGVEALDFDIDPRGELPIEIEREIQGIVTDSMQFTFGHEYAHYLRDHISAPETTFKELLAVNENSVKESKYSYDHTAEFEADYFAIKQVQHNKKIGKKIAWGGFCTLFFLCFIEQVNIELKLGGLQVSETHPRAIDRLWKLHRSLGNKSPVDDEVLMDWVSHIDQMVSYLRSAKENGQSNLLTFYGSIYLPNYKKRILRDRVDF